MGPYLVPAAVLPLQGRMGHRQLPELGGRDLGAGPNGRLNKGGVGEFYT